MQDIKTIPTVSVPILLEKKAISPNNNWGAFTSVYEGYFFTYRVISVIGISKKYDRQEPDDEPSYFFKYSKNNKICDMCFSQTSDKLFVITENKNNTKLHNISFSEGKKQRKVYAIKNRNTKELPFAAKCLSATKAEDTITVANFSNNTLQIVDIPSKCKKTSNLKNDICNLKLNDKIESIRLNQYNNKVIALLKNKTLCVIGENNNNWNVEYSIDNCISIPECYNNDGSILVCRDKISVQIITMSPYKKNKKIYYHDSSNLITSICLNYKGDKLAVFHKNSYKSFELIKNTWQETTKKNRCRNYKLEYNIADDDILSYRLVYNTITGYVPMESLFIDDTTVGVFFDRDAYALIDNTSNKLMFSVVGGQIIS